VKAELAYTYQLFGKPEEAAKPVRAGRGRCAEGFEPATLRAQAQLAAGGFDAAKEFLKRAASLMPKTIGLPRGIRGEVARYRRAQSGCDPGIHRRIRIICSQAPSEGVLYPIQSSHEPGGALPAHSRRSSRKLSWESPNADGTA